MTLARTALRLACVEALRGPSGVRQPTIAENRVYDSRISDFSPETFPEDAKPTVIVLTDDDEGDALSRQNGGPPFRRIVSLVIEFAMVQGFDIDLPEGGTAFVPGYPSTDAEHEASLDLLEFQIARRLGADLDPKCALFRSVARIHKHDCHRQVLDETGAKIAARVLTWQVEITDDQERIYQTTEALPTGLDVLPNPLRTVAKALPEGSNARNLCVSLADMIAPLTAQPLRGVDSTASTTNVADGTNTSDQVVTPIDLPVKT